MKKRITTLVVSMLTLAALSLSMVGCSTPTTNDAINEATTPQESILAGGMQVG